MWEKKDTVHLIKKIHSLKTKGKGAIVIPTGFITAKSGVESTILKHIVDEKIVAQTMYILGLTNIESK